MNNDKPFTAIGTVTKRTPLQGSFCNVRLCNRCCRTNHIIGLCQDPDEPEWPRVGSFIRVTGTIRNGRHITKSWEYADA